MILKYGPDINKRDKFNRTPLHQAAKVGNETAVKILIDIGMPTQNDDGSKTPA